MFVYVDDNHDRITFLFPIEVQFPRNFENFATRKRLHKNSLVTIVVIKNLRLETTISQHF